MRTFLIPCIATFCLALPSAEVSAQAARSAAQLSAPPPPIAEMMRHVPAHMTAVMAGDVQALVDGFGESMNLGFDAEPMLRAMLATATRDSGWTEHGVLLDQARRGLIAFHEPSDRAMVVMDSAGVNVPTLTSTQPYRLGHDAILHQLDPFYGVTTEDGPWVEPAQPFDLNVVWPEAAPFAETAIWWAYLNDAEIFHDLDREFHNQLSAAGASRGFVAVAPDASVVVLADTDVAGAERFLGRVQATTATWDSDSASEALERLHFEAALSRVSIQAVSPETVAIHLAAPNCGGLTQQAVGVGMVSAGWIDGEQDGRALDGAWGPTQGLLSDTCEASVGDSALAWEAMRLVPDETPAFGVIVDLYSAFSLLGRTLGGFAPYVLDDQAFRAALDGSDFGAVLQPGSLSALIVVEDLGSYFSFGGVASDPLAAFLDLETTPVAGIGDVFGNIPATLPETAPFPEQWQSLRDATPDGAVGVVLVNSALARDAIDDAPPMFTGALTNAVQESSGLVFAVTGDEVYSMRIHGIPPSSADAVRENILALAADAADLGGYMLPETVTFGARFLEHAIEVDSFDTGVEVRLLANPSPLFTAGAFFLLSRVAASRGAQPSSMPSVTSP